MYRYLFPSNLLFHTHEFILSQIAIHDTVKLKLKLMVYDNWKKLFRWNSDEMEGIMNLFQAREHKWCIA